MAPMLTAATASALIARAGRIEPRKLHERTKVFLYIGLPIIVLYFVIMIFKASKAPPGKKIDQFFTLCFATIIVLTPPFLIWVLFYYHQKERIQKKPRKEREEFKRKHPHLAKFFSIDKPAANTPPAAAAPTTTAPNFEELPEYPGRPQLEQVPTVILPDDEDFADPDQVGSKAAATSVVTDDETALRQK